LRALLPPTPSAPVPSGRPSLIYPATHADHRRRTGPYGNVAGSSRRAHHVRRIAGAAGEIRWWLRHGRRLEAEQAIAAALLADPVFAERFRPRVVSTTLTVAGVTDGRLHDSVHFAAGIALCRAAGCVLTGLDGEPPHAGAGGLIVAAGQETHATLLDLVRNR